MHIAFLTDFFPPETNAAANRVMERARLWVEWGHEVTVITSVPNFPQGKIHPGYRNRWRQVESMDGIRVVRVKTYVARNTGTWRRGVDFASYMFSALPVALAEKRPDVVIATSPNFFAGLTGSLLSRIRGTPFILEVADLWPAFIIALGEMKRSWLIRLLEALEGWMYRSAIIVVCLSPGIRRHVLGKNIPEDVTKVILNGVDRDMFSPGPADCRLVERYGLDGKFVAGYFGTMGAAHGVENLLKAAPLAPEVTFLLAGDGAFADQVREMADRLPNVIYLGPQPRHCVPDLLRAVDVVLVHLRDVPELGMAIPSKLFEAMGCGRATVLSAPKGDATSIVEKERCGMVANPGRAESLVAVLNKLRTDGELRRSLEKRAVLCSRKYSRRSQARAMLELCSEVV